MYSWVAWWRAQFHLSMFPSLILQNVRVVYWSVYHLSQMAYESGTLSFVSLILDSYWAAWWIWFIHLSWRNLQVGWQLPSSIPFISSFSSRPPSPHQHSMFQSNKAFHRTSCVHFVHPWFNSYHNYVVTNNFFNMYYI